jgi:hypothetical protein
MKTIFDNDDCIILWDDGTTEGDSTVSRVTAHIGWDKLTRAQEVWTYISHRKLFFSYKNKGHINEIIQRMAEVGVNLKISAASLDTAVVKELRFATDKDEFHFHLKF